MRITQIVQETTTSGSVATVSQPIGNMQKRMGNKKGGSMFAGKTTNKPFYEAEISEQDLILVPGQGRSMKPGFISKAADRTDREVEMALGDLFQAAKNAKMTYDMLKDVGEDEGIEGWVQEKIIKASDYLNTIREYLENKRLQREGTLGAIAGGVAGAYLGKSPSAAITGAEIGSELQDTFATEGSHKTYQPKHVAWVVRHGDGKVSEFKPHEDDAARAQFERVKGNRGASIYAIDQHSQSIPMGSLKAMRKKQDVAEGSVDQLPTRGADYSKYDTEHLKMMLRPGILHRNEARFKALIRKELQKREQQSQQDVAEGYEPGDKITWYHSNHHPEIEGTVVGWKDGHLIVKSIDPQTRNTEKTVAKYRVPKNNILSHNKQGVAEDKGRTMSRAAKGYEKYGKEGMQALAKAGREGKDLDKIRDKYNKYD